MPLKSFRGLLADGGQDRIFLHTTDGKIGYKITKFEIMSQEPYGGGSGEHLVKVWSRKQVTIDGDVDFSDNTLLGAAIGNNSTSGYDNPNVTTVIFDSVIFNQDIYVTHHDGQAAQACNYHIEVEQIALDLNENTVATLKDIRNLNRPL
jgi:hypothetical protein